MYIPETALHFKEHRDFSVYGGNINPINGIIYPTIFSKPLHYGGNYREFFAPVFFVQCFHDDAELSGYFLNPQYARNAMYISLFGTNHFVENELPADLHPPETILHNTDLHLEERGIMPYGGRGAAASCIWVDGKQIPGSTLPQRDIYHHIIKPSLGDL